MKRIGVPTLALMGALMVACNADSRLSNETETVGTTGVGGSDKAFVESMASTELAEVELGKLAQDHATSADVKQYAAMMVHDHRKAGDELKQAARHHGIPMPTQLDDRHRNLMTQLSKMQGTDFDRLYITTTLEGHEDAIDRLQTRAEEHRFGDDKGTVEPEESNNPVDATLNQWAANTIPVVRKHLDEARRIRQDMNIRTPTTR